jgi:hypothetical protein
VHFVNICVKNQIRPLLIQFINFVSVASDVVQTHHVTRHNTPIHNILRTAPELSISQNALGTLPEDGNVNGNVIPKHVGA